MSKEVYGMKDNSPRWILWKFGLTTITKVHCQGNKQNLSHIRYARKHPPPPLQVLFHDERMVKPRGDGTSIFQIQLGTRQLGRERGKWSIKRGGGATRKGLQQNLREKILRRIKERVAPAE